MDRRTILAIVLTALVWVLYFLFLKPNIKQPVRPPVKTTKKIQEPDTGKKTKTVNKAGTVKSVDKGKKSITKVKVATKAASQEEKTVKYSTEKYSVVLSARGASITSIKLRDRKDENGNELEVIVAKSPYGTRGILDFPIHFDESEFLEGNELENAIWLVKENADRRVIFYTDIEIDDNSVRIEKIYSFPEKGYKFNLEYKIINKSKKSITFPEKKVIISATDILGPRLDYTNTYNMIYGIYSLNGEFEKINKGSGIFSKSGIIKKETGNINWVGLMSRYLLVIMIPEDFSGTEVLLDNRKNTGFRTGMSVPFKKISAGAEIVKAFTVYLGEKDKDKLKSVNEAIIDAADVSKWIEPIRYFVMWSLLNLQKLVGNLGWALVIFSIITKIIFMPLTLKSTESMKKMQSLSPMLKEIKAKYKDKPDVIQKKTMELYKEHKVNPMGGCFPLLLQMPFFFGLYSALINSIDLWHAPFVLWIKDLSMPDTVMQISGYNLNILPIAMTLSTFVQQKLTTVDAGQQQKMMTYMMPVIFIFIFWSMPSGLVLYWTLQNLFQVLHQLYVTKRDERAAA